MISIDEALASVLERACPKGAARMGLERAADLTLAEDIRFDMDSPPYDKALMDGYAVRAADVADSTVRLEIVARITAGSVPRIALRAATAARIMTGAPLPQGADAVVMIERTTSGEGEQGAWVRIDDPPVVAGQNILRRGLSARRGEVLLRRGHRLRPRDVGVLCEAGRTAVRVIRPPRVAVLATGDELVPPGVVPGAGQIRNTNGPLLAALARQLHAHCETLPICRDDRRWLDAAVRAGLDHDVLLLSGGVSTGDLDLVPAALRDAGVQCVFHKVHLKPGKPLWFGMREQGGHTTHVFGLPGNPVGCLVCFRLFVRPLIQTLIGIEPTDRRTIAALLACDYEQLWDRPTYYPVVVAARDEGPPCVTPIRWQGSADQRAIARADGLALFPPGRRSYPAGYPVDILLLEEKQE